MLQIALLLKTLPKLDENSDSAEHNADEEDGMRYSSDGLIIDEAHDHWDNGDIIQNIESGSQNFALQLEQFLESESPLQRRNDLFNLRDIE